MIYNINIDIIVRHTQYYAIKPKKDKIKRLPPAIFVCARVAKTVIIIEKFQFKYEVEHELLSR